MCSPGVTGRREVIVGSKMRQTPEEFVEDLVRAGAPKGADPAAVAAAASEIARAAGRGAPTEKVLKKIAAKYPELRGPAPHQKSRVHPSPRPVVTARDIMRRSVTSVDRSMPLLTVAEIMRDLEVDVLPVHDESMKWLGTVTDRDIVVRAIAQGLDPAEATAGQISSEISTVHADEEIDTIVSIMEKQQPAIRRGVVVLDSEDQFIGLISEHDLAAKLHSEQGE
ncbi:CBS domain-containing protein [Streptomyces sp. NPDC005897]|uniref:CBS domain-containing protein n=1 Tax=Streptomyces sp. NPDC005897 TaxID=3157081 RepID=UPI0033DAE586